MAIPVTRSLREDLHLELGIPKETRSYTPEQHEELTEKVKSLIIPKTIRYVPSMAKTDDRIINLVNGVSDPDKGRVPKMEGDSYAYYTEKDTEGRYNRTDDLQFLSEFIFTNTEQWGLKFVSILSYFLLFGLFFNVRNHATIARIKTMVENDSPIRCTIFSQKNPNKNIS